MFDDSSTWKNIEKIQGTYAHRFFIHTLKKYFKKSYVSKFHSEIAIEKRRNVV